MNALRFKRLSSAFAAACLAVGRGQRLAFTSAEDAVQLTLGPLLASGSELPEQRLHLSSQHGALHLSNADALLSLCGEIPVISAGPMQGWYWQLINQQLAVALHDLLAPLEPVPAAPAPLAEQIDCHLSVARGGEKVHGVMSCSAQTLLRLLDAADWLPIERALPADWPLNSALALGSVSLTLSELSSVRPGDVLLPTRPLFDSAGHGRVQIGHRQWAVEMYTHNDTVRLRLLYEEAIRDTGQ